MQDLANNAEEPFTLSVPRAIPSARFIQSLGKEIQAVARRQASNEPAIPFEEMVVELRKLVRLLCQTLVPVEPRPGFVAALRGDLDERAAQTYAHRHHRTTRWLMVGGILGSAISLLGLVAALLLRRRNGRLHAEKPVGAASHPL